MDPNNILAFIAVATLLVISPGPNGFLIAKTVPLSGQKAGYSNILGFVTAFYLHGTLSILGISILLVQSSQAFFFFKMLGALYLIWIGVKALINAVRGSGKAYSEASVNHQKPVSLPTAYFEGLLTNVLNPKVSIFYLAAFPQFLSLDNKVIDAYTLVTAHALINVIWFSAMIIMLSKIKSAANNNVFRTALNAVTGIVFMGFGAKLALMEND